MNKKIIIIIVALLIAAIAAGAYMIIMSSDNATKEEPGEKAVSIIEETSTEVLKVAKETGKKFDWETLARVNEAPYSNIMTVTNEQADEITVLINKHYALPSDFVPKNIITSKYGAKLREEAANALDEMFDAAKTDGVNLRAVSGYRSVEYQRNLYNSYLSTDSREKVDTYSARPGHSEHNLGLAIDIDNNNGLASIAGTKEDKWLKENAYKYGFIQRYTQENIKYTGYKDEPWHYRFLGKEVAKDYYEKNPSSYEEYYVKYLGK